MTTLCNTYYVTEQEIEPGNCYNLQLLNYYGIQASTVNTTDTQVICYRYSPLHG